MNDKQEQMQLHLFRFQIMFRLGRWLFPMIAASMPCALDASSRLSVLAPGSLRACEKSLQKGDLARRLSMRRVAAI